MYRETKWKQFLNLKRRKLSVVEYEKEFSHLSKYGPELVLTEAFRCRQFEDGLNESIKKIFSTCDNNPASKFLSVGSSDNESCKTRENSNFRKKGKMVISVKIQTFS